MDAIHCLQRVAGSDCGFRLRPSLQIATRKSDLAGLRKEYEARHSIQFPVRLMNRGDLGKAGMQAAGALRSEIAAEMDPYRFTHRLLRLASARGLPVFDRITALRYETSKHHVIVITS